MKSRGSSLVEVLLAIAVFSLLSVAMVGVFIYGRSSTATAGAQNRALQLAQEGQSAIRNIRDADFNNLVDGTYGLAKSGGVWVLGPTPDVTSVYTRTVTISTIDMDTKEALVEIDWQQNAQRDGHVELRSQYTTWQSVVPSVARTFRVNEYFISSGFTGTSYSLALNQDLESDYFVIIEGSDGDGSSGGTYGPHQNYIRLTHDPFGTSDLGVSGSSNTLRFTRSASGGSSSWRGVVRVVECLDDCANSGFRLHDVREISQSSGQTSGAASISPSWSQLKNIQLVAGYNGAGCSTSESNVNNTKTCHTRFFPDGGNELKWTRDSGGASLGAASNTVMVVDWGSEWNIQRVNPSGSSGGNGADSSSEYDSKSINPVARDNTWVWGVGHTDATGIGNAGEGVLITLGNGAQQLPIESSVSIGMEYNDSKNFEVYALTHPDLKVDYRFKLDGNGSDLLYTQPVDPASSSDARMALVYNGQNGTGTAYPRPMFSARYASNTTIQLERRRSGQDWPAWIQGIDFSNIIKNPDTTAPSAVTNLSTSSPTQNSVNLAWTSPGDDGASGTASSYDVRYSTSPILEANWSTATSASGEPSPKVAGSNETMTVSGLTSNTRYYFALKTSDEAGNISVLSNTTTATTSKTQADSLIVSSVGAGVCCGDSRVREITIGNSSPSTITIDRMIVSWTGGGPATFDGIRLDNNWNWGPNTNAGNGSNVDIVNHSIPFGASTNNEVRFGGNITGTTLTLTFIMVDGSQKTLGGIAL